METREQFLTKLLSFNAGYDKEIIGKAFDKAEELHHGQARLSGEPYIVHPMEVAIILAQLGMDDETLVAGLLHDVVEDTSYTRDMMTDDFGEDVALLVDGVTKLGSIKFDTKEEAQAENLRKMFLAMSKDIRVLIIKLADRLHNMRTAEYWGTNKQKEKSRETLDIYAPLAARLGMYNVKFELEDTAMMYLWPEEYEKLSKKVSVARETHEIFIKEVIDKIKASLDNLGIHYDIYGRSKHLYSIYKKMIIQKKELEEIFDLTAIRIIVDNVRDCYAVLGQVHTMWKPLPGRFKDYIAMPKPNMYQSLHTTLLGENGEPFEIQIRTYEMHQVAEYGIAAHWKYKEGKNDGKANNDEVKLAWLRQTLEWQQELNDPKEFMETLRMDLFSNQVFVFTPKGEVMELPAESTPLDFAFKVHTDVGCHCVGAKVNGKMVTIDHPLHNGDIVEIVTSANSNGPSVNWLKIAKSSSARNKIRQWLKKANRSDDVEKGKVQLDKYIRKKGYDPQVVERAAQMNRAMKELGIANALDDLYVQISKNSTLLNKYANLLFKYYDEEHTLLQQRDEEKIRAIKAEEARRRKHDQERRDNPGIIVRGVDNLMIRLSKCCNPVPGDEIIGFITKGRGISVHRKDCTNIISLPEEEKSRMIEVEWEDLKEGKSYNTDVLIRATDRKRLISDISKVCDDLDIDISGINAKSTGDGQANITLTLSISSTQEMQKVLRSIRNVEGVTNVYRARA